MTKSVIIRAVGAGLPERRVSNDELSKTLDTSDEWIRSHTGIGWRHLAADGETTSDLAVRAARQALERAGVTPADIDLIVLATTSPDYFGCPPTACIVQHKLGATQAAAFDLVAACSGFIYGLTVAKSMLLAGTARRALVIGAEVLSRVTDWTDRNTCVLFGDGAGAAVVDLSDTPDQGILNTRMGTDGSGWEYIVIRNGGAAHPYTRGSLAQRKLPVIEMNGKKVFVFAVRTLPEVVRGLVAEAGLTLDDLKWIVPHQANARIIQAAADQMKIPESRFYMNLEQRANTSSASIPLALCDLDAAGGLKRGDLIAIVGFGSGLTYGGALIRW
ncbi:MAG: ketoacyl-ACP synthase III [Kiritimatiellae bacterium]|nr:ketoacyl-ACP synthase III [Kiritimatiellia bacterium]